MPPKLWPSWCIWCVAFSLGLGACTVGRQGPTAMAAPAYARYVAGQGKALQPGSLVGQIFRLEGASFVPAVGAKVVVDEGLGQASADAEGGYGFEGLNAGGHALEASFPGHRSFKLQVVLNQAMGLPRANLLLVPEAGDISLVGVVVDPRGAALPYGEVEAADADSGARLSSRANAMGFYQVELPTSKRLAPRLVNLSGHGESLGGIKLEASRLLELSLNAPSSVALGLDAFAQVHQAQWLFLQGRKIGVQAQALPKQVDELVLRWEDEQGAFEVAPTRLDPPSVEAELPVNPRFGGRLELRVMGLVPPQQQAPSLTY